MKSRIPGSPEGEKESITMGNPLQVVTIAPSRTEKLTLWNFDSNIPGLVPHELQSINKHNFDTLEPITSKDCRFWFASVTFVGLEETRQAFEKTWSMIKEEVYSLRDVEWIAELDRAAVCTYTFHWKGFVEIRPCEGKG